MRTLLLVFGIVIVGLGCSPTTPKIEGKWDVISAIGDGRNMTEGGDWFEFKADQTVTVRMSGGEESGKWEQIPEKSTLVVQAAGGAEIRYDYQFRGDSLVLKTIAGKGHQLEFVCAPAAGNGGH